MWALEPTSQWAQLKMGRRFSSGWGRHAAIMGWTKWYAWVKYVQTSSVWFIHLYFQINTGLFSALFHQPYTMYIYITYITHVLDWVNCYVVRTFSTLLCRMYIEYIAVVRTLSTLLCRMYIDYIAMSYIQWVHCFVVRTLSTLLCHTDIEYIAMSYVY